VILARQRSAPVVGRRSPWTLAFRFLLLSVEIVFITFYSKMSCIESASKLWGNSYRFYTRYFLFIFAT